MDLMKIHPQSLIEKIQSSRANFINQKGLDQLDSSAKEFLKEKSS